FRHGRDFVHVYHGILDIRIPPDPSWPKIPPRRSSNNTDDIIEPPCVVTLTGTPKKGRSIVQPVACQHLKSKSSQKYEAITHIGKRLPGCFDPRFRRQITRQKAEKPDDVCNTKHDRQTPELDIKILQETEQHEDKSRETGESVDGLYTSAPCHDVDTLLSSVGKSTKKTTDKQSILEAKHCPWNTSLQHATNERHDVGSGFISQGEKQESNRPLLLMVDEKKIHALPIDSFNVEATCLSAPAPASAPVRVPVVAYRDISRMPTQMEKDVKMPSMCENDAARETVGNICTRSTISMCNLKESRNEKYPLDDVERCQSQAKNSDGIYITEKKTNKSISKYCDGHSAIISTSGRRICERDKDTSRAERYVASNVSLNQDVGKDKDRYGNFALDNALDNNGDADDADGRIRSYSNLNTAVRLKNFRKVESCGQSCATMPTIDSSSIADGECDERKMSSERKMVTCKTWMTLTSARAGRMKQTAVDRDNAGCTPSANAMTNDKILEKGMESLVSSQVCGIKGYSDKSDKDEKEYKRAVEDGRMRVRVRRVNVKRKAAPMNLSRKAKSFFRKKSRLARTDSACTLILPGYRCAARVKGKRRYEKTHAHAHGRSKVNLPLHRRNGINSMTWNSILVKYNASKQGRITSRLSTNPRVGTSFEKPSSIPLETRELLNKSYWEYYWKLGPLRRKIASAKPDNAAALGRQRQKDRECSNEDHLPESQTLRQCSVLSCMINTALRDSTTADGRPPSDPAAANVTSNARESVCQVSAVSGLSSVFANKIKMKRKKMKRASKRLLGLRAIALLCIAMYVAVIFLPMMYDYFFAEEYEDENATYIELTFRYIVSSFGEALDGVIDVLTTILLRPVRFDRKQ
ncbi:uncharacterized protein LOC112453350, partial [Temnothorax curvispinosus]|uniref:Uncharacterized protein LOC112453350 n=1 Tax=Temnothorax curvispinosus TaxID=300111 RepID=A0A6J1PKG4_9HYME